MSEKIDALTHGFNGLVLGYASVWIPMLVGLYHRRAPPRRLLWSPLAAIPTMFLAGISNGIVGSLLPLAFRDSYLALLVGATLCIWVGYIAGRVLAVWTGAADFGHLRGAVVMSENAARAAAPLDPSDPNAPITLAGHALDLQDEMKHFKFIGTTGTGKSTAIRELLSGALTRGDRAIIADPDGGYLDTFYDESRGDVILNPFSTGSAKWSLFGEISRDYDVDQLARALIPDSADSDPTWIEYARTFFTALVQQRALAGQTDDRDLLRMIESASVRELALLLGNTPAAPLLASNEKMLSAVRTISASALRPLKYTSQLKGPDFSIRRWVSEGRSRLEGGQGGVLFIPYMAGEIAALRSIISAWMRIAIFEAMSMVEGDHRLWFAMDELDALGEIDGLKDALARLRKFGGRGAIGLQSISQASATYKAAANTIVENCGTTFIFRCSASERGGTSEFASRLIGQREVVHTTRSWTRRSWFSPTTKSESIKIEPAVMPSEIERLPDLQGFLKIASRPDWHRVTLIRPDPATAPRGRRPTATPSATSAANPAANVTSTVSPPSAAAPAPPIETSPLSPTGRPTSSANPARKRPRKPRARPLAPPRLPSAPPPDEQLE